MIINDDTLKIIICDDEKAIRMQLRAIVEEFMLRMKISAYKVDLYSNGDQLDEDRVYADIALMDIELGRGIGGIHAGEHLRHRNPDVILIMVTGYMDFIDEAMEQNVFRYVSKPINKARMMRVLNAALKKVGESRKIVHFTTPDGGIVLKERDIICLEGQRRKVIIHTIYGPVTTKENFQTCLNLLNGISFAQTHRSFLVNLRYVKSYDRLNVILSAGIPNTDCGVNTNRETVTAYMSARKYFKPFKEAVVRFIEVYK